MKESISFKVSCYIPFPLEGLEQTIRPPMIRGLRLYKHARIFFALFWSRDKAVLLSHFELGPSLFPKCCQN